MIYNRDFRKYLRIFRSLIWPMGDIGHHLSHLTKQTAYECGFKTVTIQTLEEMTYETCIETGLAINQNLNESIQGSSRLG